MAREPDLAPTPLDGETRQRVAGEIADYFASLPPGRINQHYGHYYPDCAVCVGAHLDHFLNGQTHGRGYWNYAAASLAEALGITTAQVRGVLRKAGAPDLPFGTDKWPVPPAVVFRQLAAYLVDDLASE